MKAANMHSYDSRKQELVEFRKAFESVNLGVVPSDPEQLIRLTIGSEEISEEIREILEQFPEKSASRIYMGYYGSGKSHHLQLVRSIALQEGWVTSTVELDPKSVDPSKGNTFYRAIISGLEFPKRMNGGRNEDFVDLIKEIRDNWSEIRSLPYLRASPWIRKALEILRYVSHRRDDETYMQAINWLAGEIPQVSGISNLARKVSYPEKVYPMPQTKDNGLIYVFHLVVLNQILKKLGYKGLALIIDEAEHVRTFAINKYWRANNFFNILARCAHPKQNGTYYPKCDTDITNIPAFWNEGPHYSLFVGLTEGEDIHDLSQKKGEMSVLIYSDDEIDHLEPPSASDYENWVHQFLLDSSKNLGEKLEILSDWSFTKNISEILREKYESVEDSDRVLRNWTKLAGFPAAYLLSKSEDITPNKLLEETRKAASDVAEERLPWDEY